MGAGVCDVIGHDIKGVCNNLTYFGYIWDWPRLDFESILTYGFHRAQDKKCIGPRGFPYFFLLGPMSSLRFFLMCSSFVVFVVVEGVYCGD